MASPSKVAAEIVVSMLSGFDSLSGWTVRAGHLPRLKRSQCKPGCVVVGPAGIEASRRSRSSVGASVDLFVCVYSALDHWQDDEAARDAEIDGLVELVESITHDLVDSASPGVAVGESSAKPLYDPSLLDQEGVFASVVSLTVEAEWP